MRIVTESAHRSARALDAYFRRSLNVEIAVGGDLSARPGFFTFGGAVCSHTIFLVLQKTEPALTREH